MKHILSLLAIFVLASFALLAQPKLEMENGDEYNWGNVKPAESPLKAKVKIYNRGDAELHVTNVRPGCGCTTAPLDRNTIPPGESAVLDITLNVASNVGQVTKSILIESDDAARKSFYYYLKATIVRAVETNPQYLVYNELYFGREATSTVIIKNTTDKNITIQEIELMPQNLVINIKPGTVIRAKSEIPLEVRMTPAVVGTNHIKVTLKTDHPDAQQVEISGWGNAVSHPDNVIHNDIKDN